MELVMYVVQYLPRGLCLSLLHGLKPFFFLITLLHYFTYMSRSQCALFAFERFSNISSAF